MFEQKQQKRELLEHNDVSDFLETESQVLSEAADMLLNSDRSQRRQKSTKLTMFLMASLAAFGALTPREASSQEQSVQVVATENVLENESDKIRFEARDLMNELNIEDALEKIIKKLGELNQIFNEDIHFDNWKEFVGIKSDINKLEAHHRNLREMINTSSPLINKSSWDDYKFRIQDDFMRWRSMPDFVINEYINSGFSVRGFEEVTLWRKGSGFATGPVDKAFTGEVTDEMVREELSNNFHPTILASMGTLVHIPEQRSKLDKEGNVGGTILATALNVYTRKSVGRTFCKDSVTVLVPLDTFDSSSNYINRFLIPILRHEIVGHSNDWESSVLLAPDERLNFLYDVVQRYKNENRFDDSRLANYNDGFLKVREFWAYLAEAYLNDSDELKNEYPEDFELAKKWIEYIIRKGNNK